MLASVVIVSYLEEPALLRCSGDEDRATQALRRRALSRAQSAPGDVRIDLAELVFADASLMVDFAMLARRLRETGRDLRLFGAQPQIGRLIELVGLQRLAGVVIEGTPAPERRRPRFAGAPTGPRV